VLCLLGGRASRCDRLRVDSRRGRDSDVILPVQTPVSRRQTRRGKVQGKVHVSPSACLHCWFQKLEKREGHGQHGSVRLWGSGGLANSEVYGQSPWSSRVLEK